jgi:FixJ family two-component response regulator
VNLEVYYLDDEPDLCDIFLELFSSNEVLITTFTDPEKLTKKVIEKCPNLIFLDYRLPFTNGDEVAQLLPAHIPKYLITGEISAQTSYPFVKVLKKPYPVSEIVSILDQAKVIL